MYYSIFVILEILKVSIDEDNDSDNDNDKGTEYLYLFVGQAPIWYLLENNWIVPDIVTNCLRARVIFQFTFRSKYTKLPPLFTVVGKTCVTHF